MKYSRTAVVLVFVSTLLSLSMLLKYRSDQVALNQCIEDVQNKCGHIFNYTVSLEEENARLNKLYRQCKVRED